jgi:hypothetical protein
MRFRKLAGNAQSALILAMIFALSFSHGLSL